MKIFVSYKQSWVKEKDLKRDLSILRKSLDDLWHKSFIYYLDIKWKRSPKEVIEISKKNIENSDLVLCFINYEELSEWMLLELWIAYELWKDIMVLINKDIVFSYYLVRSIAKKVIEFDNINDLVNNSFYIISKKS